MGDISPISLGGFNTFAGGFYCFSRRRPAKDGLNVRQLNGYVNHPTSANLGDMSNNPDGPAFGEHVAALIELMERLVMQCP